MGKLKKVLLTIGTVIAMVAGTLVPVPAAAAPSTSFQLIAFGVKVDSTATTVTDIGWGRGNSQKGWTEGNWWPGKLVITNVQTNYPGLSGLPDIYVSFDFTANTGARFVDLVRDIQVGTTDLTDNQGWPGYDTGNSSNLPTLAQVRAAQNSVGEAAFPGYTMGESTPGWSATAQVNLPLNGNTPSSLGTAPGTTTDGKHQFVFYADQIKSAVSSSADTIIIYFEMHLSRTFIWSNGLESGYSTPGSDTYPEGGWLYGLDGYTGATPDRRNGSGFAPGSSGHAALNMTGLGNITCQIPVPPQPTGTISGYKWQDDNSNGVKDGSEVFLANWGIHIFGTLEGNIVFSAETFTDSNGNYSFPNLVPGLWTIEEHNYIGTTSTPVWTETYPSLGSAAVGVGVPTATGGSPYAAVGWAVTLTDAQGSQGGLNFGNVLYGSLTVTKVVVLGDVVNPSSISKDFTVTVTGPSYPSGYDIVFHLVNGVLQAPTSVTLSNILPGTYTISEANPGSMWSVTGGGSVNVVAGQTATSTVTNTFVPGSLSITKAVVLGSVVNASAISQDFTVTVTGPSYPSGHDIVFHLVNGVLQAPATVTLDNLIPGSYTVSEANPGANWSVSGTGGVTVSAGQSASATVTNTFLTGSLKVTKSVILGNVVNPGAITQTFSITITGPSYPSGDTKTIGISGGDLIWDNLIPGSYTVTEGALGAEWSVSITGSPATVPPSGQGTATVTNTFVPGSLSITKSVVLGNVVNASAISQDFTVTVTGPSYPSGHDIVFHLVNGVLQAPATVTLDNLIPGSYTVSEANPGANWSVSGTGGVTVSAGQSASATVTNTFLTGSLKVTKSVILGNVVNPGAITQTFSITITGPSYPSGDTKTIDISGGDLIWANLIPGSYTVTEGTLGAEWSVSITGSPATVPPGGQGTATVTNTFLTGSLKVTKSVILGNVVNPGAITQTFSITITGPSYPSGNTKTIGISGGDLIWANLIPGSYTVTEGTLGAEWSVNITGSPATVPPSGQGTATVTNTFVPGSLSITKVVVLTGYMFPNNVNEDFTVTVIGPSYPSPGTTITFHVVNGVLTNSPQTLNNLIPGSYSVVETTPADGMWTVTGGGNVTVVAAQTASSTITNTIKLPHTTLSLVTDVYETVEGENVVLHVSDLNDGAVPIGPGPEGDPHIHVIINGTEVTGSPFSKAGGTFPAGTGYLAGTVTFVGGDTNNNNIMDVGETWKWDVSVVITVTTDFTLYGGGYDGLGNEVDGPAYPSEVSTATVLVRGATRTMGFWSTHLDFTTFIFDTYCGGDIDLGYPLKIGTADVNSMSRMMGIFWANNAKNSDDSKRSKIGQAREMCAQQALAAILNSSMPGGKPLPAGITLASIRDTLTNGTIAQINALNSALDAYNQSGDNVAFDPSLPPTGRANPQGAKTIADIPWADSP